MRRKSGGGGLPHACRDFWGGAADRLERASANPASLPPAGAPLLGSKMAYVALQRARADLSAALGVSCPPPPPWRGGGGEPADLRSAALALCGALAADRSDPLGQHDPTGTAWLVTGGGDAGAVTRARRLLVCLERAFTGP